MIRNSTVSSLSSSSSNLKNSDINESGKNKIKYNERKK